ncbi:MAG: DUF2341 domain-containing protein, partial [Thermoplasmata archaeon]|nr:DUF2341 domain-containing protein [Thermoplasmata archaeon]
GSSNSDYAANLDGLLDEVRVSKIARSGGWITAEYNNQVNPSLFYTVGNEEQKPGPILPLEVSNPSPAQGATGVILNPTLTITVEDGDTMNVSFSTNATGSWAVIGKNLSVGSGTYRQIPTVMNNYNTKYYWSVNVTDGTQWMNKIFWFKTEIAPGPWWNADWRYRKSIVISHAQIAATLTNFPVLISFSADADLAAYAQVDGDDIVFTDYNGNALNHEIEKYGNVDGHLVCWVNVTSLSSLIDPVLYMYYGNTVCDTMENPQGVWDSNYVMVQHLEESSGIITDSTSFHNNGTEYVSPDTNMNVTGKINGAIDFDGTDDYVTFGQPSSLNFQPAIDVFTMSFWVKTTDTSGVFLSKASAASSRQYHFYTDTVANGLAAVIGGTQLNTNKIVNDGTWHHIVGVNYNDAGTRRFRYYIDGTADSTVITPGSTTNSFDVLIGARRGSSNSDYAANLDGLLDEVHVSNIARSGGWITTEYNNQKTPSTFYNIGNEEINQQPEEPVLSDENPVHNSLDVPVGVVTLKISIHDYQNNSMSVTFRTNASGSAWSDIGSNTSVPNGTYSQNYMCNDYGRKYWWSVNCSDGTHWTNQTYCFTIEMGAITWWNSGWRYRKEIAINHSKIVSNLINFPVLITIEDSDLRDDAQNSGDDIVFTDHSNHRLYHEIEMFNGSSGELVCWVNVPSLSNTEDTILYIYYGNPSCGNQQSPTSVWDSNYVMVQHLDELSGTHYDSTSYGNNGTPQGGVMQNALGKIDGADDFDGVDDYIDCGDDESLNLGTVLTLEVWAKTQNDGYFIARSTPDGTTRQYNFVNYPSNNGIFFWYPPGSGNYVSWLGEQLTDDAWHHIVLTINVTTVELFKDGISRGTRTLSSPITGYTTSTWIGARADPTGSMVEFNGTLDEIRISSKTLTSSWIKIEYNNQYDSNSFFTIGIEQQSKDYPIVFDPVPTDGAMFVSPSISQLQFSVADPEGDLMDYHVATSPNIGSDNQTGITNGTYTVAVSGLNYSTLYTWVVHVSDGDHLVTAVFQFTTRSNAPIVSNPSPMDGAVGVPLNPILKINVNDFNNHQMNVIFKTNASGSWKIIGSNTSVGNGTYSQRGVNMTQIGRKYYWSACALDIVSGNWTNETYSFTSTTVRPNYIQVLGSGYCGGFTQAGRSNTNKDVFYVTWQQGGPYGIRVYYAEFNRNLGWVTTNAPLSDWSSFSETTAHPFFAYFDDKYHVAWMNYPGTSQRMLNSTSESWESFQSMQPTTSESYTFYISSYLSSGGGNPISDFYVFDNTHAWLCTNYDYGNASGRTLVLKKWSKDTGWGPNIPFWATSSGCHADYCMSPEHQNLLPLNKTNYLLYYQGPGDQIHYLETTDGGETWGSPHNTGLSTGRGSLSFARYGNTYYMIHIRTMSSADVVIDRSTNGKTWSGRQTVYSHPDTLWFSNAVMVDQESILWSAKQNGPTVDDVEGGVFYVSKMLAYPGRSSDPYPLNGAKFNLGTTTTFLNVTVHGNQTYDVAFYWINGTYIGMDRLLQEGDIASIKVSGLIDGNTYQWYAITRGATYDWIGEPDTTSDENRSDTWFFNIQAPENPMLSNPSPPNGAVNVNLKPMLSITAIDGQGDIMNVFFRTNASGIWQTIGSNISVGNGTYYCDNTTYVDNIDTLYYWSVNVTDPGGSGIWTNQTYNFRTKQKVTGPYAMFPELGDE